MPTYLEQQQQQHVLSIHQFRDRSDDDNDHKNSPHQQKSCALKPAAAAGSRQCRVLFLLEEGGKGYHGRHLEGEFHRLLREHHRPRLLLPARAVPQRRELDRATRLDRRHPHRVYCLQRHHQPGLCRLGRQSHHHHHHDLHEAHHRRSGSGLIKQVSARSS